MSKTLTASVKLNTTDAENKLKRLAVSINYINKAINGKSTNALEKSLDKQLIAAQKVRKATADAELAEMRLASAKEKQAQAAQAKIDAEERAVERQLALESSLLRQKQQNTWQAFQAEQAAYEQSVAQQKQAETQLHQQRVLLNSQKRQQAKATEEQIHQDAMAKMRKQYQAEEKSARKLAEQDRRLRQKQHAEELRRIEKEANAKKRANQELANDILGKVNGVLGAYLGVMGLRVVINTADVITSAENKLNNINGGDTSSTQAQMDAMYAAAQRSRMGYGDMMANVSKSMTLAPDAFKGDVNNAIKFQEIMGKSYALGGASAAEQSSSMYQLIQSLGSGKLQGDELRSMTEGAPLAAKAIEKYAQEIYGTTAALKDMGSQGLITSEIVIAAMMKQGAAVDEAFANTKMTFAQAGVMIKNTATKAFEPALQKINEALNILAETGVFNTLIVVLTIAGKVAYGVASAFAWVAENWNWLKMIILPLLTLMGLLTVTMVAFAVQTALATAKARWFGNEALMAWIKAAWPVFLVIAVIVGLIAMLNYCGVSFAQMAGIAVGAVFWLAATMWNIFVGVLNGIIQYAWTNFVEPWIGIIEWVLNVFNGGFDSFGGAVANLLGQIISWFLSLGKVVTKIIDAIFGTNWTDGLTSLQDEVLSWGKNEDAITLSREAPELLQRTDTTDAFDAGYKYGEQFGTWATDKLGGLADWDEMLKVGNNIDDNTGNIADSMKLTAEDLKYLRDVANMEWKKEFTTANITVDMTNNNNVSNDFDLNSLAVGLRNLVEEEMYAVANGTYA